MKKSHILALLIIVVAVGAIISTFSDSSTYANFTEAFNNPDREYHVVGKLDKSKTISYDPSVNANLTLFTMIDNNGQLCKVYLNKSKPQDFERSESIVLIGKAKDNAFYADEILMKCPSKYNEENKVQAAL